MGKIQAMNSKIACAVGSVLALACVAATLQNKAYAATTPYKVVDGYKVDDVTMTGFRTWRAAACDRCHGANQEGLVGPSLVDSLKTMSKEDFVKTVSEGRLEKGMPPWSGNQQVMGNIDALYAYLKGRSDGAITKAHVEPMAASTPTS
jgi:mono/diheme cytochrome c family protein